MNDERLLARVRRALLEEWDPIGINAIPEASDEYDSYASDICGLLIHDASHEQIVAYLAWLQHDHIGLPGGEATIQAFARRLKGLLSESP